MILNKKITTPTVTQPASAAFSVVAEDSSITPCGVYLLLDSQAEIKNLNVSNRMDFAHLASSWEVLYMVAASWRPCHCGVTLDAVPEQSW